MEVGEIEVNVKRVVEMGTPRITTLSEAATKNNNSLALPVSADNIFYRCEMGKNKTGHSCSLLFSRAKYT